MFRVYWITCNPGPKHIGSCKLCLLIREELLLTCTYLGLTAGLTLWFDDSAKAIHLFLEEVAEVGFLFVNNMSVICSGWPLKVCF